jgi:hypothetical protein
MLFDLSTDDLGCPSGVVIKERHELFYVTPTSLVPEVFRYFGVAGEHIVISRDAPDEWHPMLVMYLADVRARERDASAVKFWSIPLARAVATRVASDKMRECITFLRDAYAQYERSVVNRAAMTDALQWQLELIKEYFDSMSQ